jgi:hypothetical protein
VLSRTAVDVLSHALSSVCDRGVFRDKEYMTADESRLILSLLFSIRRNTPHTHAKAQNESTREKRSAFKCFHAFCPPQGVSIREKHKLLTLVTTFGARCTSLPRSLRLRSLPRAGVRSSACLARCTSALRHRRLLASLETHLLARSLVRSVLSNTYRQHTALSFENVQFSCRTELNLGE